MGIGEAREPGVDALPLVAFAGGGTAGHVFPGIAVAEELARRSRVRVEWIGTADGVERKLVTEAGFPFHSVPAGKLRRYISLKNVSDAARILAGVIASLRLLGRMKPSLLFSKGGFASVPPVAAARLRGIPAFTHESDFDPGLATRINLRLCEKVLVSFPETMSFLPPKHRHKAVVTGNPVRAAFSRADPTRGKRFVGCGEGVPLLLVIGGSLGSSFLNSLVSASLPALEDRFFVVHQTGAAQGGASRTGRYFPSPFFAAELPDVMAAADLVISRSGANVLAELAALGKPSILVPFSSGSRGDQLRNAEFFRKNGAARVLSESEASPVALLAVIDSLLGDRDLLRAMGGGARALGGGNPAAVIAELILRRIS